MTEIPTTVTPPDPRETLQRWIPAAVFILLPILLVFPALAPGRFLFGHDVVGIFYSLYGSVGKALASGTLPVWDPHVTCGAPLIAATQSAVFYPGTWLAALTGPGLFWTLSAALHLSLAGFFAHAWLRRGLGAGPWGALAGALVFMLSGFVVTRVYAGHVSFVCCYPWAAALLWRLECQLAAPAFRRAAALGACLAMMILAGFPQAVLIAGLALLARLGHFTFEVKEQRRSRVRIALGALGGLALGVLLAAPQLLMTAELAGQSQRTAVNSYELMTQYSLRPEALLTLAAPTFFGDDVAGGSAYWGRGNLWEACAFVGLTALAFAALGATGKHRQSLLWTVVALGALILALGHHTPVYKVYFHVMPGAGLFRAPARYLLLFTMACVPLVALGFDRLWTGDPAARRPAAWLAGIAGALFLAAAGTLPLLGAESWPRLVSAVSKQPRDIQEPLPPAETPEFLASSRRMSRASLLWAMAGLAGISGGLLAFRAGRRGAAAGLGLLLLVELIAFDRRYFAAYSQADMEWPPAFVESVKKHPRFPFRIATVSEEQIDSIGKCQLGGLDQIGGYDPMMLRRFTELINVARGRPAANQVVTMVRSQPGPVFDLLGARLWIVPGPRQEPPGWSTVGQLPSGVIYENPRALPRAFLVPRSVVIASDEDRLKHLTSPSFDGRREVVLEAGREESFGEPGEGSVALAAMEPGRYVLRTEHSSPAYLVLSEAWYPGWRVKVDGVPAALLRADHLLQAVRLEPGRHDVTFSYRATFLGPGFVITLLTLLVPPAVLRFRKRRSIP